MKTYQKNLAGDTNCDVVEETRDVQIIYKDNVATQIQIWTKRALYLGDTLIRTEEPFCTVVDLVGPREQGSEPFGNAGVTLGQAMLILNVLLSNKVPTMEGAIDGTATNAEIPEGIAQAISQLETDRSNLEAEVTSLGEQASKLREVAASLSAEVSLLQSEVQTAKEAATQAKEAASAELDGLTAEIARLTAEKATKEATLAILQEAIVAKSDESTTLTAEIDAKKKSLE